MLGPLALYEGLLVGVIVIVIGFWQLWSLRRDKRRAEERAVAARPARGEGA